MTDLDERAERALRGAMGVPPGTDDPAVEVGQLRRRARRRRVTGWAAGAVGLAVAVSGLVVALPRAAVPPPAAAPVAPGLPPDPAPPGWRTEYYRSVSFEVPASWGHEAAPAEDWCADSPDGRPEARHREPYVSLGPPSAVRQLLCPPLPESMLTEHVEVAPYPAAAEPVATTTRRGRWWVVQVPFPDAVVRVVSSDRARAERIARSAGPAVRPPCPATHPVQGPLGVRPQPAWDLSTAAAGPTPAVLCQYDRGTSAGEPSGGLRAVRRVDGAQGADLAAALAREPEQRDPGCGATAPEIAAVIRWGQADGVREVYVQAAGCPQARGADGPTVGGVDDGRTVRRLTRTGCQAIPFPVPPVNGYQPLVLACSR